MWSAPRCHPAVEPVRERPGVQDVRPGIERVVSFFGYCIQNICDEFGRFLINLRKPEFESGVLTVLLLSMKTPLDTILALSLYPVLKAPYSSREIRLRSHRCINFLRRLPAASQLRFVAHAAADGTPQRLAANDEMEMQGFVSFRLLAPILKKLFPDIWPH